MVPSSFPRLAVWPTALALAVLVALMGTPTAPAFDAPAGPPDRVVLRGAAHHRLGSAQAPVVMVELSDYECPFCRAYQAEVFPVIKARYIDTGKVQYQLRDLPLDIHAHAILAAEAARCAAAQGHFWPMRAALSRSQAHLSAERFTALARETGLALGPFQACLDQHRYAAAVRADLADALAAHIYATPSFVIGRPVKGGVAGFLVSGGNQSALVEKLEQALQGN